MVRKQRDDAPGTLHHVYNRGIARRTMFETRDDVRFFFALLASALRRREIRVFAFAVLTTHYHLLVQSSGMLGRAMQRIQTAYSRRFNRSRKRDGPLVRSRYASRRVATNSYRATLLHYIDRNPVEAGLVETPESYEFGSASFFARGRVPRWLDSSMYDPRDRPSGGSSTGRGSVLGQSDLEEIVLRRLSFPPDVEDPMDDLVGAAPGRVRQWMVRKARLADGSAPGLPVARRDWVVRHVGLHQVRIEEAAEVLGSSPSLLRKRVTAGLLRRLCGCRLREIVQDGIAPGSVSRHLDAHRLHLLESRRYGKLAADITVAVLGELPPSASRAATSAREQIESDSI